MNSSEAYQFSLALAYAATAHAGQRRRWSNLPYIVHPMRVASDTARYVAGKEYAKEKITIAMLHDVVEDTPITRTELENAWGMLIAHGVWGLTNCIARGKASYETHDRAQRKAQDREHLSAFSPTIQLIKILDVMDNLRSWPASEAFVDVRLEEARLLAEEFLEVTEVVFPGIRWEFMEIFDEACSKRWAHVTHGESHGS